MLNVGLVKNVSFIVLFMNIFGVDKTKKTLFFLSDVGENTIGIDSLLIAALTIKNRLEFDLVDTFELSDDKLIVTLFVAKIIIEFKILFGLNTFNGDFERLYSLVAVTTDVVLFTG